MSQMIEMVGGPHDGVQRLCADGKGIVMFPLDTGVVETFAALFNKPNEHTVGHAYAVNEELGKAYYLGRKSQHELKAEHGGYNPQSRDDIDDADWWKSGSP